MSELISNLLKAESQAILNIPETNDYNKAIELINKQVHELNGKVVVSGMGKAGQIALNISTTLSSTGTPSVYIHAAEAQHGDLGIFQKNDILLVISNSGVTKEITDLVHLTHNLYENIPVILITGNADAPLSSLADVTLLTGNPKEICPLGLTPTTSTTTMTVLGDLLVYLMMTKIGFTKQEYAKRHHGGYLGIQSKK